MNVFCLILFCLLVNKTSSSVTDGNEEQRSVHAVKSEGSLADKNRQASTLVKCICPNNEPIEHDSAVINALKRRTVTHLWSKNTPSFVGNQIKMKEIILKMLYSDVRNWQATAFFSTTWMWSYLSSATVMPPLCAFAQMINATIAWETSKNAAVLADAIDQVAITLANSAVFTGNYIIKAAGCVPPNTTFKHTECFEKGFVYQINELWSMSGFMMPCAYERVTKQLYQSKAYIDKLMALIATISISQPFSEIGDSIDEKLIYETMQFQNILPIPACCCKGLIAKIKDVSNVFSLETTKAAATVKSKYSKNWDRKKNLAIL